MGSSAKRFQGVCLSAVKPLSKLRLYCIENECYAEAETALSPQVDERLRRLRCGRWSIVEAARTELDGSMVLGAC